VVEYYRLSAAETSLMHSTLEEGELKIKLKGELLTSRLPKAE
jgi:hypothetical protein